MSATLDRPAPATTPPTTSPAAPPPAASAVRDDLLMLATMALLVTACLPLARVFVGLSFFRPVLGGMLIALGLAWGARRLGAGAGLSLLVSIAGWFAFISAAFLSDTLFAGFLPTQRTIGAAITLAARGLQLVQLRPAPAFAEAGLMMLTISGVWAITWVVEGLVSWVAKPFLAILTSLVLWVVPLVVAPKTPSAWAWSVPFLVAAALLLLSFAGSDLRRWGAWTPVLRPGEEGRGLSMLPVGGVLATVAIVAGVVLAGALPGFGDAPWYEVRGIGGTTLTTNPIVDIRSRLVAQDTGPVMEVTTDRPVYLRTTALDQYSSAEEWTNSGIRASAVEGGFPLEVALGPVERVRLDVEVQNLPQAVLVPSPYQALTVSGPMAEEFRYDRANSTVTLASGRTLERGDAYSIVAAVPSPTSGQLDRASVAANPALRQLPPNVPSEVRELAQDIAERAGAITPFQKALAVQSELRSWRYSTTPPQGHGGDAMLTFIRNRIGYCEQYAGTMAVMLRVLGLPARVAVGYTPGDLVEPDGNAYSINNGNAHAWVEVLFDGLGWVAFEPTPRSDGNVLVPTASNVAPSRTVAQREAEQPQEPADPFEAPQQDPDLRRIQEEERARSEAPAPQGGAGGAGGGAGGGGGPPLPVVLVGLLGTTVLVGAAAASRARGLAPDRPPLQRVLHARDQVEHLGRGMRLVPAPWETDREYLHRVAHRHGAPARQAAESLALQTARARYALELPEAAATDAEAASAALQDQMLRDRGPVSRGMIRARGRVSALASSTRARLSQLSSSSRRRAPSK